MIGFWPAVKAPAAEDGERRTSGVPPTVHCFDRSRPTSAVGLIVALISLGVSAPCMFAAAPIYDDPALEARVDSLIRHSVESIYGGQLDSAEAAIDAAAAIAPGDPRIDLFRFRVLRENFPDDINEESRAQRLAPLLLAPLDRALASCDSILALRKRDPAAMLYRGWAHMMKAQTHAIAGQVWAAGGESRKGKGDLDRYLEKHGEDADAGVIVGGYLYFADILPSIVKFIKFLIRVPGGNKDRGLALLARGASTPGTYTTTDAKVVLAVIFYLFEGRIDEAVAMFEELAEKYPYNPRVVELLGSTALIYPETSVRSIEAQNRLLAEWKRRVRGWDDLYYYRLLWLRARVYNQTGEYEAARRDLERIVDAAPPDPFWLTPRALLGLASIASNLGDATAARTYAERVLGQSGWSRYHDQARKYLATTASRRQRDVFVALARVRRALYGRNQDPETARRLIAEVRQEHGQDPRLDFLDAELKRQLGDMEAARAAYEAIVADGDEAGFESTRLMSLLRLGEIALAARRYDEATRRFEQAREIESGYTLLGNVIRGRLRYTDEAKKKSG